MGVLVTVNTREYIIYPVYDTISFKQQ